MSDKTAKREQIMRAAETLFASRRFHEITVDDIAHRAGVGKGTIYRYFENKEDLFFEVAVAGYDALCELIDKGRAPGDDFDAALRHVCAQIADFFHRRHRLWHVMQAEERRQLWRRGQARKTWATHRGRLIQSLTGLLQRGVDDGVIRVDLPLSPLAVMLLGMIRNSARTHEGQEALSSCQVVELFLHGAMNVKSVDMEDRDR